MCTNRFIWHVVLVLIPSGHTTFIQRHLNVNAMSWRCIDVEATLYRRYVSAGKNRCVRQNWTFGRTVLFSPITEARLPRLFASAQPRINKSNIWQFHLASSCRYQSVRENFLKYFTWFKGYSIFIFLFFFFFFFSPRLSLCQWKLAFGKFNFYIVCSRRYLGQGKVACQVSWLDLVGIYHYAKNL